MVTGRGSPAVSWSGHEWLAPRPHVDEVEVVLVVETRGPEHCGELIGALRAAGYTLAFG